LADIWIISDGKPGHLNQSLGLAEALVRLRPELKFDVRSINDGISLLKTDTSPKLILSAGRRTHWWSWLCKLRFKAKNVVMMRPSLPLACFDLVLVPEHDQMKGGSDRVEATSGALNRMVPGDKLAGSALVLVGGPSKHVRWKDQEVINQLQQIRSANPEFGLRVATSRRTPNEFLELLKGLPNTEIIQPESVGSDWLPSTLAETERVWVTSDSVSMVYEALTAGCFVSLIGLESVTNSRTQRGMQMLLDADLVDYRTDFESTRSGKRLAEATRCAQIILEKQFI
jgi:mitochondrial fission protein ELM1